MPISRIDVSSTADFSRTASRRGDRELGRLLTRSAAGSRSAFSKVYDRTSPEVYGLSLELLGDRATAGDWTVGAYVAIHRSLPFYDPRVASNTHWVMTTAHDHLVGKLLGSG